MSTHVVILGAGFGGLELTARLSAAFGDEIKITLIDKNDAFVFGFSKFELMFGRQSRDDVSSYYRTIAKPGVEFRQELMTSIDPVSRRVVTDKGAYDADVLVVALGADYDFGATPGFVEGGHEFYSVAGALRLRDVLPTVTSGNVVVAVLSEPFKCPPAPCEAAMLLDEYFSGRGVRGNINISVVSPWGIPIPASGPASTAILERFRERNITFVPNQGVTAIDPADEDRAAPRRHHDAVRPLSRHPGPSRARRRRGVRPRRRRLDPGRQGESLDALPGRLRRRRRHQRAGAEGGHLRRKRRPRRRGASDRAGCGTKARPTPYDGAGSCFIEFGDRKVGRVDVDFLTGPSVVAPFTEPSLEGAEEKKEFASSRRALWFGS